MPGDKGYVDWTFKLNGKDIPYGLFLGEVVNFLIIALVLYFFIVKFLGLLMKSKKAEETVPPPLTKDQELLMEIRDLMKARA
jgi:large conductance mechanosensitive channel